MKTKAEQSEVVKRALAMLQSPSPAPGAEKAEETGKPDYRALYRDMASNPLFDNFPLIDGWLADYHPALWRKIRELDNKLTEMEQEGAREEVYQGKLEELLALCQQARRLRGKEGVEVWFQQ